MTDMLCFSTLSRFSDAPEIPSMNAVLKCLMFFSLVRNSLQTLHRIFITFGRPSDPRWLSVSVSIQVLVISRSLIQPLTVLALIPFFVCFAMLGECQFTTNTVNSQANNRTIDLHCNFSKCMPAIGQQWAQSSVYRPHPPGCVRGPGFSCLRCCCCCCCSGTC